MTVTTLTDATAREALAACDLAIVLFESPSCPTCRTFDPVFEEAADRHPGVAFFRVDSTACPGARAEFGVEYVPHLAMVADRALVWSRPGPMAGASLDRVIRRVAERVGAGGPP